MRKKTHAEFVEEIKDRGFTVIEKYDLGSRRLKFRCNIDGHIWSTTPNHILTGTGCPKCAGHCGNDIVADHGDWLEVDVGTKKHRNKIMKIDKIDYEAIIATNSGKISAFGTFRKSIYAGLAPMNNALRRNNRSIHRLVLPGVKEVDHKNGDGLDNRFSNLRSVTRSQNSMNSRSKVSSEFKGVFFCKKTKKWGAQIVNNGRNTWLGRFKTIEEAWESYKKASLELHGEYSYFNREEI